MALLVAIGVLGMAGIGVGSVLAGRDVARREATADAERVASRFANLVVAPVIGPVLGGDVLARRTLDDLAQVRLKDGSISGVQVWDPDGRVLYSQGVTEAPTARVLDSVRAAVAGRVSAHSARPVSWPAAGPGRFLSIYVPIRVGLGGRVLALGAHLNEVQVDREASDLTRRLSLVTLIPLLVLQLVEIPVAVLLARRITRRERERHDLHARVLSASEDERRAIAADLHDGVVQDLAGAAYLVGAVRAQLAAPEQELADSAAAALVAAVASLRRLMIDIYPPDLSGPGLPAALGDLAAPLRSAGVRVAISAGELPVLAPATVAALYRVAREALRNIAKHAAARNVEIELNSADYAEHRVRLRIVDDGTGIAPDPDRPGSPFGLRLLQDRIAALEGTLLVRSNPRRPGTTVEAVLPVAPGPR